MHRVSSSFARIPLPSPYFKLNFDGSFYQEDPRAGIRGIIQNYKGEMVIAFSPKKKKKMAANALEAEILALNERHILSKKESISNGIY